MKFGKEKIQNAGKTLLLAFVIVLLVFACMYHSSCQITPEGISLVTENSEGVKITGFKTCGNAMDVFLSDTVVLEECFALEAGDGTSIDNFLNAENKIPVIGEFTEEEKALHFKVDSKTHIGKKYELYSVVRDRNGSSLSFSIPFYGENDHFPVVAISEVNESYSQKDNLYEYVELYVLKSGNLFGLELITASDEKSFELPCVEVEAGEYVVVHLRKSESPDGVSELGSDFNLSTAPGSVSGARDIWLDNTQSVMSSSAEIVILNNKAMCRMLDCLPYCKEEYAQANDYWKTESLAQAAVRCIEAGVWQGSLTPIDAVYSTERKTISYISRLNIPGLSDTGCFNNDAQCWMGTTKSKMTPGKPNSI